MYAQQSPPSDNCSQGNMQTFNRGGYSIPANYQGNAFTLDEIPANDCCDVADRCAPADEIQAAPPTKYSEAQCDDLCDKADKKRERGLLSGILDRFSRTLELDDILLIGLIVLLLQNDCDSRDETVILLALLLLGGF